MSKALRATGAAIAGIALGLVGITVFAGAASAVTTQDVVITSHIVNTPDDGSPTPWARDTFIRTTTIHTNTNGSYHITIEDKGTFTTTKGAPTLGNPELKVVNKVTGDFVGHWDYLVTKPEVSALGTSALKPDIKTDETFDYTDCPEKGACGDDLPTTGNWPAHFFTGPMTITPSDNWYWKYTTPCETLENGNAVVKDGKVENVKGNITGQTCPTVAPTTPPTTTAPIAVVPVSQPSLPVTGVSVPAIVTTGIIVLAIGGFAIFFTRRRKTN